MAVIGWVMLLGGFAVAVLPGMLYQVVNGASLLGVLMSVAGAWMIWKGVETSAD